MRWECKWFRQSCLTAKIYQWDPETIIDYQQSIGVLNAINLIINENINKINAQETIQKYMLD